MHSPHSGKVGVRGTRGEGKEMGRAKEGMEVGKGVGAHLMPFKGRSSEVVEM